VAGELFRSKNDRRIVAAQCPGSVLESAHPARWRIFSGSMRGFEPETERRPAERHCMRPTAIAYLLSAYPDFHETFVAREVEGMRQSGIPLRVYSLKRPSPDAYLYPDHAKLVRYLPFLFDARVIAGTLKALVRHPLAVAKAIGWLTSVYWRRPKELAKAIAILPKTLTIAGELEGTDVAVHAHWATIPTSAAVVIQMVSGRPFSITAHAWDIYLPEKSELRDKIRRCSGLVTCTAYNVQYLRSVVIDEASRAKINLNYHGIDLSKMTPTTRQRAPGTPLKVVAVGRLVEQKGFSLLVEAVGLAAKAGQQVEVTLIGDGPLQASLEQLAEQHGVRDRILFAGRVGHAQTIATMCASDVLIAPSVIAKNGDRDGIPNVILEAMACGLPIIGSAVSGIPEVVRTGDTGHLVPPEDAAAVAQGIAALYADPVKSHEMGGNARRFIEKRFGIDGNVAELVEHLGCFHHHDHSGRDHAH
jgi:glycosyltransferase involved in cell wall biosynthesis